MRRYPSTKRCEPTNRLFNALDCKTTQSPFLTLSRIGCIAFSQSNWYLDTLQNEPFSKRSHHQLPLSILPSVAKHILILIYLRVDYYVRHAFLWGRFLHEATGEPPRLYSCSTRMYFPLTVGSVSCLRTLA